MILISMCETQVHYTILFNFEKTSRPVLNLNAVQLHNDNDSVRYRTLLQHKIRYRCVGLESIIPYSLTLKKFWSNFELQAFQLSVHIRIPYTQFYYIPRTYTQFCDINIFAVKNTSYHVFFFRYGS